MSNHITLGAMGVRSGGISGARTTGGSDSLSSLREVVVGWVGARDTQQLSGAVVVETHRTRLLSRVAVPPAVRIMDHRCSVEGHAIYLDEEGMQYQRAAVPAKKDPPPPKILRLAGTQ